MRARDRGRRVLALPSQTPGLVERHGLSRAQADRELWAVDANGTLFAGAAAVNRVLAELGGAWAWLAMAYRLGPIRRAEDRAYRWVAEHRSRFWFWTTTPECQQPGVPCDQGAAAKDPPGTLGVPMMTTDDVDVARCLAAIRTLSAGLADELRGLPAGAWDGPTNCPPWRLRDLAGHIVSSGEGFAASIRRGLMGAVEPGISNEERLRRQAELEAADAETVARALLAVTDDFEGLYRGLNNDQLELICFHRRGNRSVRWYAAHRLAEVAFHRWDVHTSLGRPAQLDEEVARLLLPTLLESNAPRTYAAGLSQERGRGERFGLAAPGARWLVRIDPDVLEARRDGGDGDLEISGSAASLALLVYGRAELPSLAHTGAVQLQGDRALVERFGRIFPRP